MESVKKSLAKLLQNNSLFFAIIACVYLFTLVQVHSFDALTYAYSAEIGIENARVFLHPHHLLYNPITYVVYHVVEIFGWAWGSLIPLQILNVVISLLTLSVFFKLLEKYVNHPAAIVIVLGLGLANGFWLYSVEVEVYALSALFLLGTTYFIIQPATEIAFFEAKTSLMLSLAILAHQTNVLFFLVVATGILVQDETIQKRVKRLITIASLVATLVIIPYLLAINFLGLESLEEIVYWLTSYAQTGIWGHFRLNNLPEALTGFRSTFINSNSNSSLLNLLALFLLFFAFTKSFQINRKISIICLTWFLTYALFFLWWEPLNIEFWIGTLPPTLIACALVVNHYRDKLGNHILTWTILFLICWMAYVNWQNTISPRLADISLDSTYQAVQGILPCTAEGDAIIISTYSLRPWLHYYGHLETYPIDQAFLEAARDNPEGVSDTALAKLKNYIDTTLKTKGYLFIIEETFAGTPLSKKTNIGEQEIAAFLQRYSLHPTDCQYVGYQTTNSLSYSLYILNHLE